MKVEIISVGTPLLMSDVIDTNAPHITRRLREVAIDVIARVIVGDDAAMIADALRAAVRRAEVVLVIGGVVRQNVALLRQAVGQVLDENGFGLRSISFLDGAAGETAVVPADADADARLIICLPGERREVAYVLENDVLPLLQRRVRGSAQPQPASGWVLLRTVGIMESSARQQLADLLEDGIHRITFDSFAGQTDIRIWAEAETQARVNWELSRLREAVVTRLGDHIYGDGNDRLEAVTLGMIRDSGITLALAECHTQHALAHAIRSVSDSEQYLTILPAATGDELASYLQLERVLPDGDLTNWCRQAAIAAQEKAGTDLGLVVYSSVTPGGVQLLVTLASAHGVSVTQRSFGGHPDSIDQWASTLALAHLRRWLLVRS